MLYSLNELIEGLGGVDETIDAFNWFRKEVKNAGYKLAFTLLPGSNPYHRIKQAPFTLKRVFLSHRDSFPRFAAKVNGFRRIF